jgi:serine/threonine protein kinase, bacterial
MTSIFCSKGHESPGTHRFCQSCGEKLTPVVGGLLMAGAVLEGRYRIVQQIGQGGFGRTYLCEDLNRFKEPCVLKEFAPQVQGSYALEKAKKLFEREANVLHQLAHPQIPRFRELFQLNSGNGGLFLVQDYVAGQTYRYLLAQRITQNQLFSADEIRQLLLNLLPVLEYIHSVGVIHRDIAPDNLILRSNDNLPVLIDFGGVKQVAVNAEIQVTGSTDLPTCLGKVGYAPHEQLQRGTVYPHSDIYALAATALVLLTGREPMDMIEPLTLNWNWRQFVTLDPDLGTVFDKMLQPNINARYQTASEALAALQKKSVASVGGSSTLSTVVLKPLGGRKNSRSPQATAAISAHESGEFWPILRRSWLGILGATAIAGGGWGLSKMFGSNSTTTPTSSPSVLATAPSSPEAATPNSSSPTPETSATPDSTTGSDASSESPTSRRRERQTSDQTDRTEPRTSRNSDRPRRSPASSAAETRTRTESPRATPSASVRTTPERSTTPSRSVEIETPASTVPSATIPTPVNPANTDNQPATDLPELVPSKTPDAAPRSSRSSRENSDGGTRSARRSTSPAPERSTAPKESTAPRQSTQPSEEPLF